MPTTSYHGGDVPRRFASMSRDACWCTRCAERSRRPIVNACDESRGESCQGRAWMRSLQGAQGSSEYKSTRLCVAIELFSSNLLLRAVAPCCLPVLGDGHQFSGVWLRRKTSEKQSLARIAADFRVGTSDRHWRSSNSYQNLYDRHLTAIEHVRIRQMNCMSTMFGALCQYSALSRDGTPLSPQSQ